MPIGVCEPLGEPVANIVIAKITSTRNLRRAQVESRVTRKEKTVFSALIAPVGAVSFLKEGYVVSGSSNASLYTHGR